MLEGDDDDEDDDEEELDGAAQGLEFAEDGDEDDDEEEGDDASGKKRKTKASSRKLWNQNVRNCLQVNKFPNFSCLSKEFATLIFDKYIKLMVNIGRRSHC